MIAARTQLAAHRDSWADRVEQEFRALSFFPQMGPSKRALVRSQSCPDAGSPCSLLTQIESPLFRVLLQRRLRLPPPLV